MAESQRKFQEQLSARHTLPFQPLRPRRRRAKSGALLSRTASFTFQFIHSYGPGCAVCRRSLLQVRDAVPAISVEEHRADHALNGLVPCATHHRAFDAQSLGIEPGTLRVVPDAPLTTEEPRITVTDILNIPRHPHPEAPSWRWDRWTRSRRESE